MQRLAVILGIVLVVLAGLYVYVSIAMDDGKTGSKTEACTREAIVCPDGSTVGREGPNCEFAACPNTPAEPNGSGITAGTKVTVTAKVGQRVSALSETILAKKVIEDSRCPQDVQCVWAGTVRIDGSVIGGMGEGQLTYELGKPNTSEVNQITLIAVTPAPKSGITINQHDYILTFEIVRR